MKRGEWVDFGGGGDTIAAKMGFFGKREREGTEQEKVEWVELVLLEFILMERAEAGGAPEVIESEVLEELRSLAPRRTKAASRKAEENLAALENPVGPSELGQMVVALKRYLGYVGEDDEILESLKSLGRKYGGGVEGGSVFKIGKDEVELGKLLKVVEELARDDMNKAAAAAYRFEVNEQKRKGEFDQ